MATRLIAVPVPAKGHPSTPQDWDKLMRRVMARAAYVKDRRLAGMQGIISSGKSQVYLRKMGIICENDILRVFPEPGT